MKRKLRCLSITAALAASLGGAIWLRPASAAAPQEDASGYWRGSGWSRRVSDLKWATITVDYHTEFSFHLSRSGEAEGAAIVTYTLGFDDAPLRTFIAESQKLGSSMGGLLTEPSEIGAIIADKLASSKMLVGMTMSYEEPMPVRVGKIKGKLSGQQLHLEWDGPPPELVYKRYFVYVGRTQLHMESKHPAYSPWRAPAQLMLSSSGRYEALVMPGNTLVKQTDTEISSTWTAYRVGAE